MYTINYYGLPLSSIDVTFVALFRKGLPNGRGFMGILKLQPGRLYE